MNVTVDSAGNILSTSSVEDQGDLDITEDVTQMEVALSLIYQTFSDFDVQILLTPPPHPHKTSCDLLIQFYIFVLSLIPLNLVSSFFIF